MKVSFIIYVDLESLLEKTNTCDNNPKKSLTTKINKHTTSSYSLFTNCSFDATKKPVWTKTVWTTFVLIWENMQQKWLTMKKKDDTINKWKKIRCFIYVKNDLVLMMTIEYMIKSEIIVITLQNIEGLFIIFVIQDIKHQKKFLWYFIMVLHTIIIL